jgi:hypothetical protein
MTAPAVRPTSTDTSATTLNDWPVVVQVGDAVGAGGGAGVDDESSPPPQPVTNKAQPKSAPVTLADCRMVIGECESPERRRCKIAALAAGSMPRMA